uniref:Cytochrome P450 n=1 Tax=Oryza sativa subsp. japonica TaxID=39947 RepID=Q69NF4_ORYSJ|nr:putative Cytochrome P450 [Oryza sativa Japonica Group]
MSSYVVVAAALLVFVVVVVAAIKNLGKGKLPPSPPSLPFVGHLHLVGELPHRSLDALHRRYGSDGGLMFLRLGRAGALVVSTAAAAADLYRGHDLAFASRPPSHSAERLFYGGRNISWPWRTSSPLAAPARAAEAAALVARARRAAEAARAVQLRELLYAYTNGVITRVAAGGSGATAERFRKMMADTSELLAGFQWVDRLPEAAGWAARKLTGLNKKLDDMADESDRFLGEILAAHDDEKAEGEEEDFVDVLLRLRRQGAAAAGGLELAEDNVKAIIKDIMGAATDTSFVTLEWIMTELIRNTQVMSKLQNEIIQVTGSKPTVTEEDLTKLDYLKAVIKEVLRLHPPAPLLIPHHSTMPTTIQGYHIPAKTIAFINVWAIGRDPAAWDTPDEFRPERFMGSAVDFRGNDYKFIPFGAGRRLCPGIILALPGLEMVIASLLYHFDWELPDGMDVQDLDMAEAPGLTTPPMNPVWLIPRCRTI